MKRPLFIFSIVITAIVYLYLELFLSDFLMDFPDSFDGSFLSVTGIVTKKEFKVDYLGEITPVVYITPVNTSIGKNKYIALYMAPDGYREPFIGESVKVRGSVKLFNCARNPGEFDSRLYYATLKTAYGIKNARIVARNGKINYLREGLYRLRYYLEGILDKCLDKGDSSIMKAILLGDKAFMEEESKELYKDNGIIHILAVSGLHISLLGIGLYELLRHLRLKVMPSAIAAMIFMCLYGHMCGMSSSAFRAIAMFSIRMLAPMVKRAYDMLSALAIAFLLLLLDQPLVLYNSGFLFSFGAILGIGLVMPALKPVEKIPVKASGIFSSSVFDGVIMNTRMRFADDPKESRSVMLLKKVISGLLVSISIFIVTLPVYMNFYYTYPIYSVLLNLIVLPLMAPLMIFGIGCLLIGGAVPFMGSIIGIPIHLILLLFELLCNIMLKIPGRTWFMGHGEPWKCWIYMSALCFFVFARDMAKERKYKSARIDIIRYSILSIAFLLMTINPSSGLNITMIDVDQGDGILIETRGANILIDGGSTGKKNVGKYSIIPYLKYQGIGEIDAAIITHEDLDHISGVLEIMDDMENGGIRIRQLVLPDVSEASRGDNYKKLQKRAWALKIPVTYISCGQNFNVGKTGFLCLNPERGMTTEGANAYSTVLFMKYGEFTALFTGDVEQEGQEHILRDIAANKEMFNEVTMLKVAHHGSMYTTDKEFLKLTRPQIAVISCGRDNRYGHPHDELIERLEAVGAKIFRTDRSGAISFSVKNNRISIHEYLGTDNSSMSSAYIYN